MSRVPLPQRFWVRVEKTETCWLWRGFVTRDGYGRLRGRDSQKVLAHRYAYEERFGPVPDGLQLDHLCRVRHCVNPDHLEAVTAEENVRRGNAPGQRERRRRAVTGTCVKGHPLERGRVQCRTCKSEYDSNYRLFGPRVHGRRRKAAQQ